MRTKPRSPTSIFRAPTIEQVVSEQTPFLRRTLRRLHVPLEDVDDVMQHVLLVTAGKLAAFDPRQSKEPSLAIRGLLFRICERCAAAHRRSRARRRTIFRDWREMEDETALESPAPDAETMLSSVESRALVEQLIAELPPGPREVLVMYDIEGEEMRHIAVALDVPVNTAWSRRHLAFRDLRAALQRRKAREK